MPKNDKYEAIRRFKKLVKYLKTRTGEEPESIGLDIESVEELTVINYKSRGYSKAAKVRNAKKVQFEKLDFEAPTLEAIIPLFEKILEQLEISHEPKQSIKSILNKLAPYGSWASLTYTILHNCGVI